MATPKSTAVSGTFSLGFQWQTRDPFLFCVHHLDAYPRGNGKLGPAASLAGRELGQDFAGIDGWRMYHGEKIPGFPSHPHRGFETVTIVRQGVVDHSDSLGATARFGGGDVQWLTAGRGIQHSEMFPLVREKESNPLELFQIWLNLPSKSKFVAPYFSMFWRDTIPEARGTDAAGKRVQVRVIAGQVEGLQGPPPPPDSWAARSEASIAIWTVKLEAGAQWTLPAGPEGVNRTLYFFEGDSLSVEGQTVPARTGLVVRPEVALSLRAIGNDAEILMLQGRPIGETVAQYGPFVMNTQAEIHQAFQDYQRTRFGGWPWPSSAPAHAAQEGRFARHPDGRMERSPAPLFPTAAPAGPGDSAGQGDAP